MATAEGGDRSSDDVSWRMGAALPVVLLVVVPVLVFANTLGNGYHHDDWYRIEGNPELEHIWPPWRHFLEPSTSSVLADLVQYRPLLPLSLSLSVGMARALGMERLTAFHLGNIAIHVAAVVLFYLLLQELLVSWAKRERDSSRLMGLAAALLFAVHPVSGFPVNYLCARDLLQMNLFLLAFLLVYVRVRREGGSWWLRAAGLVCLILALSSKTNAVVAPALVVGFELSFGGWGPGSPEPWRRALPSALTVLGFLAFVRIGLGFSDVEQATVERALWVYPATQLELHVVHYLRNFAWPFRLRAEPLIEEAASPFGLWTLLGLALVAASVATAWLLRRRAPLASFAILCYWVLFLPTSSLIPLRKLASDYRQYPSLPWLCTLVVVCGCLALGRRAASVLLSAMVVYVAASSVFLNRVWKDEESLWSQSVRYGGTHMAHHNYARAVQFRQPALAEQHFRIALEMEPRNHYARVTLGMLLVREGRLDEGLALLDKAQADAPRQALPYHWKAVALAQLGRFAEARVSSAKAVELEGDNPAYLYRAAADAQRVRQHDAALEYWQRLHRLVPEYQNSRFREAWSLDLLGRHDEAIAGYEAYLEAHPDFGEARYNLGRLLAITGRCREAVAELERALELVPSQQSARYYLSLCYRKLGRQAEAERHEALYQPREQ